MAITIYGTRVDADTYHLDRGNTLWAGTDQAKDEALARASEWVDRAFRGSFPGDKTGLRAQEREWPRTEAYDDEDNHIEDDVIPFEVINATYEAALREIVTPGALSPDYDPSSQVKREKVDVIEIEYSAPHGPSSVQPLYPIIKGILAPILTGSVDTSIAGKATRG